VLPGRPLFKRKNYFDQDGLKMNKADLQRIGPGFYVDSNRSLYLDMKEFMTAHDLPDRPEVRQAILEQVKQEFGLSEVTELSSVC
jgi:hypothetical protein